MSENRKMTARDTALEVLMQVERANAWSDGSLKRTIAKNGLEGREAALATRLAYGVIQNRTLLDYYISCYCVQKAHKLEPVIRNILRIGGYQILFMDKIPHRAAVNEAVEMCRRNGQADPGAGQIQCCRHGQRCAAEICDKLDEYAGDTLQRYGGIFVHPIQSPAVAGEKTTGDFAA